MRIGIRGAISGLVLTSIVVSAVGVHLLWWRTAHQVSQTLANLEAQLGVKLFDRSARYPRLTEEGRSLLADARTVADNVDEFKARARAIREGRNLEGRVAEILAAAK